MAYIDFEALVKKVNLKPKGEKEIVLEINDDSLKGKLEFLSEMVDKRAIVSLEPLVVNYGIKVDARTNRPLTEYQVDDRGIVSEVKPEGEQLEADLGIPKEEPPTKEVYEEIDKDIIDEFIRSGLAPTYKDMFYNFQKIMERLHEGETYLKLASERNMASGEFVELVNEYRKRVAPLAKKWDEWRQENQPAEDNEEGQVDDAEVSESNESDSQDESNDIEVNDEEDDKEEGAA